jgi:superfamily II DNA or RNA helicase
MKPATGKRFPGWWSADQETANRILKRGAGVGLKQERDRSWSLHETHLPLLDTPEASMALSRCAGDWNARDVRTAQLGFKLRTTQQQALDFIAPRRGVLVGDAMRLGKTLTGIMAHDPDRGSLVIVAPLSARAVWLGWLRRVFPGVPVGVLTGWTVNRELLSRPIIFAHYDIVRKWQVIMPIGTLILDEAHAITNRRSSRSNAVVLLASRAEKVLALTGTPIWKRPTDLWNVLGTLAPGAWGSYWEFSSRYGAPEETAFGTRFTGLSNGDELTARLSEIMIRRLWKDAQADLPSISRSVVLSEVDAATSRKLDVLAGKLRSERTNTAGNLAHYRSQLCKIKLKTVVEEANKAMDRGEPVVVWTWHKQFADDIADVLGERAFVIHGDVHADKREERMAAWRATPSSALVATMAVAQVGIDLSHSHLAIFAEVDYTPAILAQAEMRTYAPERAMNITFVVANHVVDQRLVRALVSKLSSSEPLGLGAAVDSIDALRDAIEGPRDEPDMQRFFDDLIASGLG